RSIRVSRPIIAPPLVSKTHGELNHRPGARLSAGSQTVLPTVRFSPAIPVVFTTAANTPHHGSSDGRQGDGWTHREPPALCGNIAAWGLFAGLLIGRSGD